MVKEGFRHQSYWGWGPFWEPVLPAWDRGVLHWKLWWFGSLKGMALVLLLCLGRASCTLHTAGDLGHCGVHTGGREGRNSPCVCSWDVTFRSVAP